MMSIQLVIILVYFALTVGIGLWSSRKSNGSASFHGAQLGIVAIVCASTGEWLGGTATTGISEYGFEYGLSGAWFTLANAIGVMVLAFGFAKLYRSLNTVTIPGIIEKYFGVHARTVSSVLLTLVMLAVGLSQMIAAGKLGQAVLGIDFIVMCVIFTVIFVVYTLAGGMKAVASTNTMHLFFMYGGILLALGLALSQVGGWDAFKSGVAAVEAAEPGKNYFNMFSIGMPKVSSWLIASILGACTAQAGIQPVLASRDVGSAKKACIITAFVVAPFGLFTALLGIIAKVQAFNGTLLDQAGQIVTDGKLALPSLMMNLPPVAGGIVLASILAAILSTVSPLILASGTMVTKDIYQRVLKQDATDKEILKMSRITTALAGVVCCAGAIALVNASTVLGIVYSAYSLRGAIFVVVLLGIYWKRASEKGACWSMVLTGGVAVVWKVVHLTTTHYPISDSFTETYAAVAVALVATIVFSLLFPKKEMGAKA